MAIRLNNPVSRLYTLLSSFNEEAKSGGTALQVWQRVLNVPDGERFTLLRRYALVLTLPEKAEVAVSNSTMDLDPNLYLKWQTRVTAGLTAEKLFSPAVQFDAATMIALQFCADAVSRSSNEPELDQ